MSDSVPAVAPALVGVEHELAIVGPEGVVDARGFADQLGALGPRLRESRRSTLRLRCGAEASWGEGDLELASPPIPVESGVTDELVAWIGTAVAVVLEPLPSDVRLEGRSTHLSISVTEDWMVATCGLFAYRFVPALMLLTEGRESQGILVRPRFGRLEVVTDYAHGDGLRAAAALAIGGVLACVDAARGVTQEVSLPPLVDLRVEGATRRFGWYVDRAAGGADLCAGGRATPLTRSGKRITAGVHFEDAWVSARRALAPFVAAADLTAADDVVAGRRGFPCEVGIDRSPEGPPTVPRAHVLGLVTQPIVNPRIRARVVASDWNESVLEVTQAGPTEPSPPPRATGNEAVARAVRSIERGVPPVARHPAEPAALEAAVFTGLADPARFVTSARLPATALTTVAAFLYERVWPRPRRKPMPRKYRLVGGLLLSLGLGIAVGALLPPRSVERVAASPAPTARVATAEAAPSSASPSPPLTTAASAQCIVTSTVSHVRTDAVDGGWIVLFPVEVRDANGDIVVGARVSITNAKSDGTSTSAEGVTGPEGIVAFGVRTTQPGSNRIDVMAVRVDGCEWDDEGSANSATGSAP